MATRRYSSNPSETQEQVVEAVGAATATKAVEVTIDLATNLVTQGLATRQVTRDEVLLAIDRIKNHIMSKNWPPA